MMIYLFLALFSLSFLPWALTGFTLKLIHRDSPLSPLYQPNLSDFQRLIRNADISEARLSYFQQLNEVTCNTNLSASQKVAIHLPLVYSEAMFTVDIGIGTPAVTKTLIFDTGSGLTWTQCKPCTKCYMQKEPLFDPKMSKSYKPLRKQHPFSNLFNYTRLWGYTYRVDYESGESSRGDAATETFTFRGSSATFSNLVFGCGKSNSFKFSPKINGIIGFNQKPYSFVQQLRRTIKGRFSYCMTREDQPTYVKFGDEAVIGRNAQSTPFLRRRGNHYEYAINLDGVSINGTKIKLRPNAFPNGCLIDSGAAVTYLHKDAFFVVRGYFEKYFFKFNIRRYVEPKLKSFVCFQSQQDEIILPGMTFNFRGADFQIPPESLFNFVGETNVFCLMMLESKHLTVLGSLQQRNSRILYDLDKYMLSFTPEDCSKDVA